MTAQFLAFLPELVLLLGALVLFFICLEDNRAGLAKNAALVIAGLATLATLLCLNQQALLFYDAYRVDLFSQFLKVVFCFGFILILLLVGDLSDIREDIRPEYYLFLTLSVTGLVMLVSCIELITLVIALELSSFPLYFLVAMRRERDKQRSQMESAIKYIMFGVAANGIMFFGMSYLFGLTGTTSLPLMFEKIQPIIRSPLVIAGLAMTFSGFYYKLAIFPFHFWTPDVYQGASNETAGLVASIPKIGAVAVLVRLVSLATPEHTLIALLLAVLAGASMLYGNLIALMQKDFKRLLGFSGIAHAGYALIGFVALDQDGFAAAIYYIVGYLFMVLACFVVICKVSKDGTNVAITELAGLHRRSPLLAITLAVGVFALAGIPPFVGFMGKLSLLSAAWTKGHFALVIFAVINAAIAVWYYLGVVRESWFCDVPETAAPIALNWSTRAACFLLIGAILGLGIVPARIMSTVSTSIACVTKPLPATAIVLQPNRALSDKADRLNHTAAVRNQN